MKRTYYSGILFLALTGLVFGADQAATIELEPTADVGFIYSSTPPFRQNLLGGGAAPSIGTSLHSGAPGRGACALLRFELSKIPAGATIESAELLLNPAYSYPKTAYEANETLFVYQLAGENAEWVEGTGTSLKDPHNDPVTVPGANATYVNMESYENETTHAGIRWLGGKTISTMDFDGEPLGSLALSEFGLVKNQAVVIELSRDAIQAWLKDPKLAQAGLVLWMRSDDVQVTKSRFAIFESREGNVTPRLIIKYADK